MGKKLLSLDHLFSEKILPQGVKFRNGHFERVFLDSEHDVSGLPLMFLSGQWTTRNVLANRLGKHLLELYNFGEISALTLILARQPAGSEGSAGRIIRFAGRKFHQNRLLQLAKWILVLWVKNRFSLDHNSLNENRRLCRRRWLHRLPGQPRRNGCGICHPDQPHSSSSSYLTRH